MKTNIHSMTDLETLGTHNDAAIIQIGCVTFSVERGIIARFKETINFNDAVKCGSVTGDTIRWWLNQSIEARRSVVDTETAINTKDALSNFIHFIKTNDAKYHWAHATFDFPVLDNAFKTLEIRNPLFWRNMRDLRTLEMVGPDIQWGIREGVHHDALADAEYQALHAIEIMKRL